MKSGNNHPVNGPVNRAVARVRFGLQWRLILPFLLLAMLVGGAALALVVQLQAITAEERFQRLLLDGGQQAADAAVRIEQGLVDLQRRLANTEGVASATTAADAEGVRARILPLAANVNADVVSVIEPDGVSLMTIRRLPGGLPGNFESVRSEAYYADWPFVQRVLALQSDPGIGDRHVGLHSIQLEGTEVPVLFVAGPLLDESGAMLGAVLVGEYLPDLAGRLAAEAGANVTLYDLASGGIMATTLEPRTEEEARLPPELVAASMFPEAGEQPLRSVLIAGTAYREALLPFEARQGSALLGVIGVSLLDTSQTPAGAPLTLESPGFRRGLLAFSVLIVVLIVIFALLISRSITSPLLRLIQATHEIGRGNFRIRVPEGGSDEIGALTRTFNSMANSLQLGSVKPELLMETQPLRLQTTSREEDATAPSLRRPRSFRATLLAAQVYGLGSLSETPQLQSKLAVLNELYHHVAVILSQHGGRLWKADGLSILASFGVYAQPLPHQISALQATHASLELLEFMDSSDLPAGLGGQPDLAIGIGIATGTVTVAELGNHARHGETLLGDTVEAAEHIQRINVELDTPVVLVSEETFEFLGAAKGQFQTGRNWVSHLPGSARDIMVFEVRNRTTRLVEARTAASA